MNTKVQEAERFVEVKRYEVQYPLTAYTFPVDDRLHAVRVDDTYIHMEMLDGRILSLPLWWIPTLYNANPAEREKFEISRDRTMIIWDPENCAINDELRVRDYLGCPRTIESDQYPKQAIVRHKE